MTRRWGRKKTLLLPAQDLIISKWLASDHVISLWSATPSPSDFQNRKNINVLDNIWPAVYIMSLVTVKLGSLWCSGMYMICLLCWDNHSCILIITLSNFLSKIWWRKHIAQLDIQCWQASYLVTYHYMLLITASSFSVFGSVPRSPSLSGQQNIRTWRGYDVIRGNVTCYKFVTSLAGS